MSVTVLRNARMLFRIAYYGRGILQAFFSTVIGTSVNKSVVPVKVGRGNGLFSLADNSGNGGVFQGNAIRAGVLSAASHCEQSAVFANFFDFLLTFLSMRAIGLYFNFMRHTRALECMSQDATSS